MTNDKKQLLLAIMRVEYSNESVDYIKHEYIRKILVREMNMFGQVVTKSEITELFEMLIAERGQGGCKLKTR